ncbi:hypothetical protein HZ326_29641 [Fusarium oxysporum f. sp. albedinis]|nr:hypothetical protein HZ326_29641 [Fusarium oxysporum f. sp. albedinis]
MYVSRSITTNSSLFFDFLDYQDRTSLGKTLAGEKPKAARTLLCGRGSRLIPRSPGKLCTISTQRFCLVVSASETNCRSPVVFRAAAEAAERKRFSGQYAYCRGRSCSFGAAKRGSEPFGARASRSGAPKGPESRAAEGCWCCSGSAKLQVSVRVRVRRPSMSSGKMPRMSSGQPKLQKSVIREVEGHRARNVAGSRSRNVRVRRSRK